MAAALLVTPGVITDSVGFLLLVPPLRRLARKQIVRRMQVRFHTGPFGGKSRPGGGDDGVIDVESREPRDPPAP